MPDLQTPRQFLIPPYDEKNGKAAWDGLVWMLNDVVHKIYNDLMNRSGTTRRAKTTAAWGSGTTTTANLLDDDGNETGGLVTVNFFVGYSANNFPAIGNNATIPVYLDTNGLWYCPYAFVTVANIQSVIDAFVTNTWLETRLGVHDIIVLTDLQVVGLDIQTKNRTTVRVLNTSAESGWASDVIADASIESVAEAHFVSGDTEIDAYIEAISEAHFISGDTQINAHIESVIDTHVDETFLNNIIDNEYLLSRLITTTIPVISAVGVSGTALTRTVYVNVRVFSIGEETSGSYHNGSECP